MAMLVGVLGFVAFLVIGTVAVLTVTLGGVVLVTLGLLLSPALALALALCLLLKRRTPEPTESRPGAAGEDQGPARTERATQPSPPASAEVPAAAVKRAA